MSDATLTPLCTCSVPNGTECNDAGQHRRWRTPEGCGCGGHDSLCQAPVDLSAVGGVSATRAVYRIANMDCPMEEALIRKKLGRMPGITGLEFNLMQRVLTVNHALSSTDTIEAVLNRIGMTPEPLGLDAGATASGKTDVVPEPHIPWMKLAIAGVFAAASEAVERLQAGHLIPFGIDPQAPAVDGVDITAWLSMVFAVVAVLFAGLTTYRKGWIAVRNLDLNINALMSVAVTGALIIGQYAEAAMVMVLFNLAEAIEAKSLERVGNAVKNLLSLAPGKATVQRPDGAWAETDIRQISIGSRVRVKPGERVALDGVILQGRSAVNQAPITGESMPVEKTAGDTVYAGTINTSGSFEFQVTAGADDSTLARIIHAVKAAQCTRAPVQRLVDQFARYYTPAVFLTALLTAVVPPVFMGGVWTTSVYTALVLLVIGCPCALVIATPVTIVSGMAAAARHGILIKGGVFLEQGRRLDRLALDKTGTLTHGRPKQTDFVKLGDIGGHRAVILAAGIAARSDHPVSRAIAGNAAEMGVDLPHVDEFTAVPGRGVSGVVDGETWYLGNYRMVEDLKMSSPDLEERISRLEKEGKSVVALVNGKGVQALFAVADTLRESSIEAVRELKQLGIKTLMLTGDNAHTARAVAEQAGVDDFKSDLLPEDKLTAVAALDGNGKIGMVGDGVNDAPALAKADIGFAMAAAGSDTAIETADVALMDDDLRKIPRFVRLSRSTYAILVQNITLAIGIKAIFLALTFMDQATMWMAVFADMGTSLLVTANGLRAIYK
ncbi:heavy metal translocating P-type ATPase [Desulfococcus multivorans]|uniref:P-type Zn(2+) transporter n=1 Tax=Desulfococcus multivorans DSM 2059 TaxID=1121405 RepID=S7TVT1_DESML|nr:heavy metal translocating P-type ATPase [Desulfococcus multivorans]AQV02460.1 cadmium-translocating P-type ATPase [Desulfococcus multivorans]EPR41141.1 heavy metal translocating P-type ATPase [Desulfococcus multivorans DSM 2059]SJZ59602.1 Cd2+/Zn2+-exporting ATPase [Desulfococcus multivorans DSM 2059]